MSSASGITSRIPGPGARACMRSDAVAEPPEQASSTFQFWRDLAHRLELGEHFPWETIEELHTYRLSPSGPHLGAVPGVGRGRPPGSEVQEVPEDRALRLRRARSSSRRRSSPISGSIPCPTIGRRPSRPPSTPTWSSPGCARIRSSRPASATSDVLRRRQPAPRVLHPSGGCRPRRPRRRRVGSARDRPRSRRHAKIKTQPKMRQGHLRVPHGWWYPETRGIRRPRRRVPVLRCGAHGRYRRPHRLRAGHPALQGLPRPDRRVRSARGHVRDDAGRVT